MITGTWKELITKMTRLPDEKVYDLIEHKEKRSKDANAYFYKLVNELANAMRTSKEEMHDIELKKYSQVLLVPLLPEQDPSGFFQYYEKNSEVTIKGKKAIYYKVYKPSHEMNTKEMSILIDGVVSDCQEQHIETKTPRELAELKSLWNKE
jgi:hypothetical protein